MSYPNAEDARTRLMNWARQRLRDHSDEKSSGRYNESMIEIILENADITTSINQKTGEITQKLALRNKFNPAMNLLLRHHLDIGTTAEESETEIVFGNEHIGWAKEIE